MKKILIWSGVILLSLVLITYSLLWIRKNNSYQAWVAPDQQDIIQINLDEWGKTWAFNRLFGEKGQRRSESSRHTTARDPLFYLKSGIRIPANIFLFTRKADSNTFYSIQTLSDPIKFRNFLQHFPALKVAQGSNQELFAYSSDRHMALLSDGKQLVLAFSLFPKEQEPALRNLLAERDKWVRIKDLQNYSADRSNQHVTYSTADQQTRLQARYDAGHIHMEGNLYSSLWNPGSKTMVPAMPADNILTFWLHADLGPLWSRYHSIGQKYLPTDSIMRYYGGFMALQWKSPDQQQTDTIITYDYDDNFEMVEKQELQSQTIPNLQLSLKGSPHLTASIPEKLYYKFHKTIQGDTLLLSTEPRSQQAVSLSESPYYLYLKVDLRAAKAKKLFPLPQTWWTRPKSLEIKAQKQNNQRSKIVLDITL